MKPKFLYSILFLLPFYAMAQDAKFELKPYLNGITSIKDGILEAGADFNINKTVISQIGGGHTNTSYTPGWIIRPTVRLPLTTKESNLLQIDRFSSTWRGIVLAQKTWSQAAAVGPIGRTSVSFQMEYGRTKFKYYPTGVKDNEAKQSETSYGFELKYIRFRTAGAPHATQKSPQIRLRYSYDWKAADAVGVVGPPNGNGVISTTDMIIDAPGVKPTFSPAFAYQFYPGRRNFSYAPAIYYDLTGEKGQNNPFNDLQRLRLESWVFFFPSVDNSPNIKIGLSPFLSIRTAGSDDFNKIEYGGLITVKFNSSMLHFF